MFYSNFTIEDRKNSSLPASKHCISREEFVDVPSLNQVALVLLNVSKGARAVAEIAEGSVVGAVIIHDVHPHFRNALAVGIGVQLASTLVTCCITSTYSKLGINVSGPDIIAAIFAGLWAKTLTDPAQGENTVLEVRKIFKQLLWQRHPCICYGCGDCSLYDSFTNLPFTSPLRRATP